MTNEIALAIRGSAATESLLGLAAATRGEQPAWLEAAPPEAVVETVAAVGDDSGEVWLHLLGLAVSLDRPAAPDALRTRCAALSPEQLMEHVVGVHVPAWWDRVERDTLIAAAGGDRTAALDLLAAEGYYAGNARSLTTMLQAGPVAAKRLLVEALAAWEDVVAPVHAELVALHADRPTVAAGEDPLAVVRRMADGLRLEPEPYVERILLVAQHAVPGWQVLAQDGGARIVVHDGATARRPPQSVAAEVFAALGEPTRLALLRSLAAEPGGVSDLARRLELAKSTVHRHLAVLRRAGLVALAGQAWRYRYEARPERVRAVAEAFADSLEERRP